MIRVVSWNIFKKWPPWHVLADMARRGEADVALLQEAGSPPPDLAYPVPYGSDEFWRHEQYEGRPIYDRWCLVVQLSDRVDVEWFRAVPPISELGAHDIAVSGIGTVAAARVTPRGRPKEDAFIAVSMYARYMKPHPSTGTPWRVGAPDVSAHRELGLGVPALDTCDHARSGLRIHDVGHRHSRSGWLARRAHWHVHFTPTSASWLNQVERWFAELTRKQLQRGVHRSTRQLEADIRAFIDTHNQDPKPFRWTKSADDILAAVKRFCLRVKQNLCHEL